MTPSSNLSLREVSYTPSVPSPLNPSSPDTPSSRRPRRGSHIRVARKMGGQLSPTQRLMRQKAAAAWRSMTLRSVIAGYPSIHHEINFGVPPPVPSLAPVSAPALTPIAVTLPAPALAAAPAPTPVSGPKQGMINRDTRDNTTRNKPEPPVIPGGEYDDIDLDDVEVDTEKQPLIACEEGRQVGGMASPSSEIAKYSSYKRTRHSKVLTRRRVLTAVGILCAVGIWTAVRPSGPIHGR
ncbi:hypothetical protein F4775DRAFT_516278 [Biscogniauxia sp. FL1348]|nr:hypothetical protein F4775DRAFT_516278 [Biscogniauxia sp. FL1348]